MAEYFKSIGSALAKVPGILKSVIVAIGLYFKGFFLSIVEGDIFVKLSLLIMGAGYIRRKQYVKGILMTLVEAVFVLFCIMFGIPYLSKFSTLGTVQIEKVYNPVTMKNEFNDYDHSFKILLFSLVSIVIIVSFVFLWINNVKAVRALELRAKEGKHINTFKEDLKALANDKFHITLLFSPVLGIVVFTIIPLLVMILVAFTNYDQNHLPPTHLFTWVGFNNFKQLFENSLTITFAYSFKKVLGWTLVWAFFATITNYIGGILFALLINGKQTKFPKFWRTLFIVSMAVPQFVSLLLVRYFFADNGIVNTICANVGITDFLKNIGLLGETYKYIPFLTNPTWAKVTIIIINMWVGIPYLMLIATGVLMNIPTDLMESAKIDGANSFQIFRKITMPYMLFVTGPYLITQFIGNINNFNVIYLLTTDIFKTLDQSLASSHATEVDLLVTWLYKLTQDYYNYKMASVIGIIVFLICAAVTLLAFNYTIKGDKEDKFQL